MLVDDAIKFAEEMDKTGSTGKFVDALNTLAGEVKRLRAAGVVDTEPKWAVDIIESERGWGQRVDETKKFVTRVDAEMFKDQYNAKNNKSQVPDWDMYATDPYPIVPKK